MVITAAEDILAVLAVLRRRLYLLCIPILLTLPLVILAAPSMPTKYMAKALVLLQAANFGNPNSAGGEVGAREQAIEQVNALQAWLTSEYVLSSMLHELLGSKVAPDPIARAGQMQALKASFSLELVSNAALEFRLEGSEPKGLGKKLEVIIARFLEGLIIPEESVLSASQFVLLKRKERFETAERSYASAMQQTGHKSIPELRAAISRLNEAEQRFSDTTWELAALKGELDSTGSGGPLIKGDLVQLISQITTEIVNLEAQHGASSPHVLEAKRRMARYSRFRDAQERHVIVQREVEQLKPAIDALRQSISDNPEAVRELQRLSKEAEATRNLYEAYVKHHASDKSGNYVGIFNSPERIMLIGRPQDPKTGESSAVKYGIAAIFVSIVLGAGLVVLAEMFDQRVRDPEKFAALTSLPIVARLPKVKKTKLRIYPASRVGKT